MEWLGTKPVIVSGKYRIECLSSTTIAAALNVVKNSFCQDEYVCIGCEVNKNPIAAEELTELCAEVALDGVSLVAVSLITNEVVAVSFNKIQVQTSNASEKSYFEVFAEERCTQASSRSLIQFMATVDERCNLFEKYGAQCSFEIMFLGALREHRGQNLGMYLCEYSIELAKRLKDGPVAKLTVEDLGPKYSMLKPMESVRDYPKFCHAIFTSRFSQKIGKDLDFTVHLTVPFNEFSFAGKTYTERIGDEQAFCEVVGKALY